MIVGEGQYRYEVQADWEQLPNGWVHGDVAGIATDSQDRVYVFNRSEHPVIVYDQETLAQMNANGQLVLRYCAPDGVIDLAANPNGSTEAVAGICNAAGNVLGLMPHPERAAEAILGEDDGRAFLQQVVQAWTAGGRRAVESQVAR